jgi:hypothetical protein
MLEGNATARRHFPAGRRTIMLEHRTEQVGEITVSEAGSLRQFGVDEQMRAVEAIGHNVLATHGAILDPFVTLLTFLPLGLFLLVGRRHASDRDL